MARPIRLFHAASALMVFAFAAAMDESCDSNSPTCEGELQSLMQMRISHGLSHPSLLDVNLEAARKASREAFTKWVVEVVLKDAQVAPDSRNHIFILGPESSATRLWYNLVREASGMTGPFFGEALTYDADTAAFHLSLPWGNTCSSDGTIDIFTDMGANYTSANYTETTGFEAPFQGRFSVDIQRLVDHYHERQSPVKALLAVRDPRPTFLSKMENHCHFANKGLAEQREAYELMVAAKDSVGVTIVCYESMVIQGSSYISDTLTHMGFERAMANSTASGTDIYDGNAGRSFATLHTEHPELCADMDAYTTLCPDSPISAELRELVQSQTCLSAVQPRL